MVEVPQQRVRMRQITVTRSIPVEQRVPYMVLVPHGPGYRCSGFGPPPCSPANHRSRLRPVWRLMHGVWPGLARRVVVPNGAVGEPAG